MDSTTTDYRTCFGTDAGKRVLADILQEAGYFDTDLKTTEEMAVLNFVNKLLLGLGIINNQKSLYSFVGKLFELPIG